MKTDLSLTGSLKSTKMDNSYTESTKMQNSWTIRFQAS